jgi:hypothetical protein
VGREVGPFSIKHMPSGPSSGYIRATIREPKGYDHHGVAIEKKQRKRGIYVKGKIYAL